MVDPNSELLQVDPAKIALGDNAQAAKAATDEPDAQSPACAASLAVFRSALLFKNIFTFILAILAVLTLGALAFCLVNAFDSSWESASTLAAITGVVTGGGALFLKKEQSKSQKVLDSALADVKKYCGDAVEKKLS